MEREHGRGGWRTVYGVAVLLVFGLFLFTLRPVLSPLILFLLLLLLLSPYAGTRTHATLVTASAVLAVLWLLQTTGSLLAPFLLALAIAYILDPIVDLLQARRVPRGAAIVLLGLPAVALLALVLVLGVPALARQLSTLVARAPVLLDRLLDWAAHARLDILAVDLPLVRESVIRDWIGAFDADRVSELLRERQEEIAQRGWDAVMGVGRGLGTILTLLGYLVLTPVVTFYLLRDYDRLAAWVEELVPPGRRARWGAFAAEYNLLLSRYLRGQVLAAAAVGVLTGVGLWIAGFPYAGLVGASAGVFNLVPYLGLVVSLVPAVLIALLSGSVLASLLKVGIVFALVQAIDSTLLGPKIVGGSVGLHPVWVMLALAVGGYFLGLVGLILAVPTAVLLKLLIRSGLERYRSSAVYRGGAEAGAG